MPVTVMRSLTGIPSAGAADSARLRIASGSCCPLRGCGSSAPASSGMAAQLPGPVYRGVAALEAATLRLARGGDTVELGAGGCVGGVSPQQYWRRRNADVSEVFASASVSLGD